jgi:shikimate kinase
MVGSAPDRNRLQRIYIVGFMGAGKTSVAGCLSRELRYGFRDLDAEIERVAGRKISEIFRDDGEDAFREVETRELRRVAGEPGTVIACGGGTLIRTANREFIRRTGISVWLDAPLDVMLRRCQGSAHRPLLADRPRMEALLAERLPFYRSTDLHVDASTGTPRAVARRIAALLAEAR